MASLWTRRWPSRRRLQKKAPLALAATKQLLNRAEEMSLEGGFGGRKSSNKAPAPEPRLQRGIAAFREKRRRSLPVLKVQGLRLRPGEPGQLTKKLQRGLGCEVQGFQVLRRSVDARKKEDVSFVYTLGVDIPP